MVELLRYLADHCGFLFQRNRFRLADSDASESFGNAWIILASAEITLRIVLDRGQIRMDFRGGSAIGERDWHDDDLMRRLIASGAPQTESLGLSDAAWIEEHLERIIDALSRESLEATTKRLGELGRVRAKEQFS